MSRSILAGAALIAVGLIVPQVPATAQASADIVVSAPVVREPSQPRNSVHPNMRFVANVVVETHDLDLRTAYGRDVLDRRVRVAADQACDILDDIEPPTGVGAAQNLDSGDCRHLAMRHAEPMMRRAIRAAGRA